MGPPEQPISSKSATLQRLTKRAQFLYVRQGLRVARPSLIVEARWRNEVRNEATPKATRPAPRQDAHSGPIGVGFTASRKAGNAVVRNRSRRRLKEAARKLLADLGLPGADYVIVARAVTAETTWPRLLDDLGNALIRLRADLEADVARPPMPRALRPSKGKLKKRTHANPNAASKSE